MIKTYGDWFSGFGGTAIGANAAGLKLIFGAEHRADVAAVYAQNLGDHVQVCDLLTVDIETFPYVDVFHASPPCPNFSNAKKDGEETANDLQLASKVAEYIVLRRPLVFTLENVYQYRNSKSWGIIAQALHTHGYQFNYWHVNMADYGVPQTRKRMIVIARRDGRTPQLPHATHAKEPGVMLFDNPKKWVGWYEAIEDLIPTLPDSEFAPWQLERLPDEFKESFLPHTQANSGTDGKWASEPATTIAVSSKPDRAFILDGQANGDGKSMTNIDGENPTFTVTASQHKRMARAFVMNEGNPNGNETRKYRLDNEPIKTVTAGGMKINAMVLECGNCNHIWKGSDRYSCPNCNRPDVGNIIKDGDNYAPVLDGESPDFTMSATNGAKGYAHGRVVKMTARALARFQSFPDWYVLPDKNSLACYGIGNAEPPLFS
ncbi:MAG: DNA cytosine methyltransferase, partial [Ketobacter sp.]|nr:DNA cytosine methyltransferase [Ketobacter sp.]